MLNEFWHTWFSGVFAGLAIAILVAVVVKYVLLVNEEIKELRQEIIELKYKIRNQKEE